jgi:hypothetical protein
MSVFKRKNLSLGLLLGILVLSAPSLAFSVPKQQYIGVGLPREFLDLQQKHNQIRSTLFQTEKDFSLRDESWKERMQNFRQEKAKLVMLQSAQRLTEARIKLVCAKNMILFLVRKSACASIIKLCMKYVVR